MAKSKLATLGGHQCLFYPIPPMKLSKLFHRFASAVAKTDVRASLAEVQAAAKTKEVDLGSAVQLIATVCGAVDERLFEELLKECEAASIIDGVPKGGNYDQNFSGDLLAVFTAVYHVLDVSGFFGLLPASLSTGLPADGKTAQ